MTDFLNPLLLYRETCGIESIGVKVREIPSQKDLIEPGIPHVDLGPEENHEVRVSELTGEEFLKRENALASERGDVTSASIANISKLHVVGGWVLADSNN